MARLVRIAALAGDSGQLLPGCCQNAGSRYPCATWTRNLPQQADAPAWSNLRIQMTQTNSEGSSENRDNEAGEVEVPGADKGRFGYNPRPPSWGRAAIGGIAFVAFWVLINLLVLKASAAYTWIGVAVAFVFYVPFSYYVDRWLYRRYRAKSAAAS